MDVNGTRMHLVYGEEDWMSPPADGFELDEGALILQRLPFVFPPRRAERPPTPDDRRGAARDRYSNWYWIAADRRSVRFRGHSADSPDQHFWSSSDKPIKCQPDANGAFAADVAPAPMEARTLAGLAVTRGHYLLVGSTAPSSLLVFDLHAGGPPLELAWPRRAVSFVPFDIAADSFGGAWILDREHRGYLGLDAHFNFIGAPAQGASAAPTFTPVNANADPITQTPSPEVEPFTLPALTNPIAIESLPDGSLLFMDVAGSPAASTVYRFSNGAIVGGACALRIPGPDGRNVPLAGHDLAFVPDDIKQTDVRGTVYVTASSGNQTFAFRTHPAGASIVIDVEPVYLPMRFSWGRALVATSDGAFYDVDERWIPLAEQPLPRYRPTSTLLLPRPLPVGVAAFNGREPRCVWHRLLIDACIPPGTSIRVESRAADDLELLAPHAATPWHAEPQPYLRRDASELPFYRTPLHGHASTTGTWELLFQRAVGQHLQLRITLSARPDAAEDTSKGAGRSTPRIHALRVYYPRFSYLREYLPAVYREDEQSASFLDRLLANVEGFYTAIEGRIEQAHALFDPRTAPSEHLEWLATWLGATLDPAWDDRRRRLFLAHAHQLFLERGTLRGVTRAVRLALDACADESALTDTGGCQCDRSAFQVRITEGFLTRPARHARKTPSTHNIAPRMAEAGGGWTPEHGATALDRAFAQFLEDRYGTIEKLNESWSSLLEAFSDISFRPTRPEHDIRGRDWADFARQRLAFPYLEAGPADEPLYRQFLSRRYPQMSDLRTAWSVPHNTGPHDFGDVLLPTEMPTHTKALADWMEFVSDVLATERRAHYFTVHVPAELEDSEAVQSAKLELARRVAAAAKPAHTDFDVTLYWALFRIGDVRVGIDTVLGHGSRFVSIVLGRTPIADGYLTAAVPGGELDRTITGRDPLRSAPPSTGWSVS